MSSEKATGVRQFSSLFAVPIRNGLFRPTYTRGKGTKMVNMGQVFAFGRIGDVEMEQVPLDASEYDKYILKKNDLLFARASLADEAGKCCIFVGEEPTTFESHVIRVRIDSEQADPRFYYYFFNCKTGKQLMETIVERTAASGIRASDLSRLDVPLPDKAIQEWIGGFGEALDRKIENDQAMNRALESITRLLFKHWFVDFEFPNDEGKPYKSSGGEMVVNKILGKEIPRGWQLDKLGNHSVIKGRIGWKGLQISEYVGDGPYIIGGTQIVDNRVNWDETPMVPQWRYDESPEIMLKEGDILMTKDGTIGKLGYVDRLERPATVASGIFVVRSKSTIVNQMFLWNYFKSRAFEYLVESRIEGSVVPHLYQRDITEMSVVLPTPELASKFERAANAIQHKYDANSRDSNALSKIRDLLLRKIISGRVRVPVEVR